MRRAARTDRNHREILCGLQKIPRVTVRSLAAVGDGMPDLIAAHLGRTVLLEVKDPDEPPSKRQLTPAQKRFHDWWEGEVYVVHTLDEALNRLRVK